MGSCKVVDMFFEYWLDSEIVIFMGETRMDFRIE